MHIILLSPTIKSEMERTDFTYSCICCTTHIDVMINYTVQTENYISVTSTILSQTALAPHGLIFFVDKQEYPPNHKSTIM